MIYLVSDNYDGPPIPIARITITSILPHNEPVGYYAVTRQQTHRSVLSDSQYQGHKKDREPHGPVTRYAKLQVAHAPGMPRTFSPPLWVSDLDMHHGTCVVHVPRCVPGSLTRGFLWSRWRGKRSRHTRRMHNPQFYVSGKRPMWRDIYTRHDRKITP